MNIYNICVRTVHFTCKLTVIRIYWLSRENEITCICIPSVCTIQTVCTVAVEYVKITISNTL